MGGLGFLWYFLEKSLILGHRCDSLTMLGSFGYFWAGSVGDGVIAFGDFLCGFGGLDWYIKSFVGGYGV
jgi:hypothetical protein